MRGSVPAGAEGGGDDGDPLQPGRGGGGAGRERQQGEEKEGEPGARHGKPPGWRG